MSDSVVAQLVCLDTNGKEMCVIKISTGPRSTYTMGRRLEITTDFMCKMFVVESHKEKEVDGEDVLVVTLRVAKDQGPIRLM